MISSLDKSYINEATSNSYLGIDLGFATTRH